jgi:hypothetical protein
MTYSVLHTYGTYDTNLPRERFRGLLEELSKVDEEHGVVSVVHEATGTTVEVLRSGKVLLLNADDPSVPVREATDVGLEETLVRLYLVADGDLEQLEARTWEVSPG